MSNSPALPLVLALACVVFIGCANHSVETRRRERAAAYAALNPEFQRLVDAGQIKAGMPEDAVYIALGRPTQIVLSGDATGEARRGFTTAATCGPRATGLIEKSAAATRSALSATSSLIISRRPSCAQRSSLSPIA
jgi:hypothetical protein